MMHTANGLEKMLIIDLPRFILFRDQFDIVLNMREGCKCIGISSDQCVKTIGIVIALIYPLVDELR